MKKIISFVLAAAMSLSTLLHWQTGTMTKIFMSLLSELNIMVGDDDGNLRLMIMYQERNLQKLR